MDKGGRGCPGPTRGYVSKMTYKRIKLGQVDLVSNWVRLA